MMEQLDLLTAIAHEEEKSVLQALDEAAAAESPLTRELGRRSQITELPGETFEDIFTGGDTHV